MEVHMLQIYPFIIETLGKIAPLVPRVARHDPDLAKQLRRASWSIALNTAEAMGVHGGNEKVRFRSALGSAYETRACLDVAEVFTIVEVSEELRRAIDRICATLYRLVR
jgi:four helix bundle protein